MPTALRDMQPWRQAVIEHGLTFAWLAERTGKSVNTVKSYSNGHRKPPEAWLAKVDELIARVKAGEPVA